MVETYYWKWQKWESCYWKLEHSVSLCWKCQRTWLNCALLFSSANRTYNDELGNLEGVVRFLLAVYGQIQQERDKLRQELLSKKNLALNNLENSQPI